jgi:hypothetical protein
MGELLSAMHLYGYAMFVREFTGKIIWRVPFDINSEETVALLRQVKEILCKTFPYCKNHFHEDRMHNSYAKELAVDMDIWRVFKTLPYCESCTPENSPAILGMQ